MSPLRTRRAMLSILLKHLDMVRLSVGAILVLAAFGCNGLIQGPTDKGLTPEERAAQDKWISEAYPAFQAQTCTTCHAGQQPGVAFLLADSNPLNVRQTLLTFDPQVVNLTAAQSSRVLTKGAHAGPALDADSTTKILDWIEAEATAAGDTGGAGTTTLTTDPFAVLLCTSGVAGDPTCPINHVSLASVGANAPTPIDLTGAEIDFVAQPLSDALYLTDMVLKAGGSGIYIEHPLFISVPPMGDVIPDSIDRFFALKMDLMASTQGEVGAGAAAFSYFTPTNMMQISFQVVDIYRPASGGTGGTTGSTGGCKVLTGTNGFYQTVTAMMAVDLSGESNKCSGCHVQGTNANAVAAMDLTGITNATGADTSSTGPVATACAQVLSHMNLQNIAQSGPMLAPVSGQDTAHPFKFANQGNVTPFQTALSNWANAEKVAP